MRSRVSGRRAAGGDDRHGTGVGVRGRALSTAVEFGPGDRRHSPSRNGRAGHGPPRLDRRCNTTAATLPGPVPFSAQADRSSPSPSVTTRSHLSAVTSQRRPGGLVDPDCGTQVIRTLLKPATTAATRPLTRTEPPRPARPECWLESVAESTRSTRIRGALSSIVSEADPEQAAIRVVASSTPMPRNRFFMLPGAPPFAHSQVYDGVRGGSRWEDVRPAEPSDLAVEGPFDIDRSSAQGCTAIRTDCATNA